MVFTPLVSDGEHNADEEQRCRNGEKTGPELGKGQRARCFYFFSPSGRTTLPKFSLSTCAMAQ